MSVIMGISITESTNGRVSSTLHLASDFSEFQDNPEEGRSCIGKKAETVYCGGYDCSALKVGMEVEVYYDKAISTPRGSFQPIKRIEVLSSGK